MGQAVNGVFYERTNPSNCCTRSDAGRRGANRPGCGIRQDASSASYGGRRGREIARSGMGLDGRLLEMGPRTQGKASRVRVGAGQVETGSAYRCGLGCATLALHSWGLYVRCRPLALRLRRISRRADSPALLRRAA